MEVTTQIIRGKKSDGTLQIILTPQNSTEKSLLGAAQMVGIQDSVLEDDGSLTINFLGRLDDR